ncbi:hypothetical protein LINGRAHAP2_LOCUS13653 [Linum grandiflorum]
MARSLLSSRAFLAAATSGSSYSASFRRLSIRSNSTLPNNPADPAAAADESSADPLIRKFEDAMHHILVRRAAPDWLPFRPGSSYWVPTPKYIGSFNLAHLVDKLANPMTHEQSLSVTTVRGWPSAQYFIKGAGLDSEDVHRNTEELEKDSTSAEVETEETSSRAPKSNTEEG